MYTAESISADCVSVSMHAFFKCGMRMGLMLCRKAHRKNRLVTRMNGSKYFPVVALCGCVATGVQIVYNSKIFFISCHFSPGAAFGSAC